MREADFLMENEEEKDLIEFVFDASAWEDNGLRLVPLEALSFEGEVDGLIAQVSYVNEYEDAPITDTFKDLFSISFSENFMVFLIEVNPEYNTEATVVLVNMNTLNNAYAEIKDLEDKGVFKELNPVLLGSLDRLKELTNEMIDGNISKGSEFFDMMYGISIVQDLFNERELDTAVFDLMSLLTPVVENHATFDLDVDTNDLGKRLDSLTVHLKQLRDELDNYSSFEDFEAYNMTEDAFEELQNKIQSGDSADLEEALSDIFKLNEKAIKELEALIEERETEDEED